MVLKIALLLLMGSLLGCQSDEGSSSSSNLVAHSYKHFAYVLNYNDNTISCFSLDEKTGALSLIETVSAGSGGNPLTLAADKEGKRLYVGKTVDSQNNHSNLQVFTINTSNGSLVPFQDIRVDVTPNDSITPHRLNSIVISPNKNLAYLSINNEVQIYSVSPHTERLTYVKTYGLGGPSAKSFLHPNGEIFIWGTTGGITLWPIDASTGEIIHQGGASSMGLIPPLVTIDSFGKLMFSSDFYGPGQFSNLNAYEINESEKKITFKKNAIAVQDYVSGGEISPDGKFLLISQREEKLLTSFLINRDTGELTKKASIGTENYPTKVRFTSNGKLALVLNKTSNSIESYSFDASTGELQQAGRANTGNDPQDFIIVQVKQ